MSEVMKSCPSLLKDDVQELFLSFVNSKFTFNAMQALQGGDFDEQNLSIAQIIVDYVEFLGMKLPQGLVGGRFDPLMGYLHSLLKCEGVPVAEDEVCTLGVNAWTGLSELLMDDLQVEEILEPVPGAENPDIPDWYLPAILHIHQALLECLAKLRVPTKEILAKLDHDQISAFANFRLETHEFIENTNYLLRREDFSVFATLIGLAKTSMKNLHWDGLEVSFYCLNIVFEFVSERTECDGEFITLLQIPSERGLLSVLSDPAMGAPPTTSQQICKTAIRWVGKYTAFFQRHPDLLPSALDFLFRLLVLPSRNPSEASVSRGIAEVSAKTISTVCDVCRRQLVSHIRDLIHAFEKFRDSPLANAYIQQKLVSAISTVGQALENDEMKVEFLEYLLPQLGSGARTARRLSEQGQHEESYDLALEVLRCLKSVGKAFQGSVDLDESDDKDGIWSMDISQNIQRDIRGMIDLPFALRQVDAPFHVELLQTALDIVKAGLCENAGPFCLSIQEVLDIFCRCADVDSLAAALSTACALVSAHSSRSTQAIDEEVKLILTHILLLIEHNRGILSPLLD